MSIITSKYTMTPINKNDTQTQQSQSSIISSLPILSETCRITDSRMLKDFKTQTFGGYNISKASAALDKAIMEEKLEPALHWALQLFLSGIVNPLWSKLMSIACKIINIYNPKLPEFIYNKNIQWQSIVDNTKFTKENILLLRNHPSIRLLLAEMVSILVLSKKRKLNTLPKIHKNEFIIDTFKSKLEAKDSRLIDTIIMDGDPSEIRISINEMAHHIHHRNINKALYWLNWILEWEKINSKKYGKYECASRTVSGVDAKYFKDVVWLIWAVIHKITQLKYSVSSNSFGSSNNFANTNEWNKQIQCLWQLYINKFTPSTRTKKQNYMIWSILYITETIDYVVPLVDRPELLFQSLLGFDKIIVSLKSQQVLHQPNNLLNVVVENNFMKPQHFEELEKKKKQTIIAKQQAEREHLAKQKKINVESLDKLDEMSKLDKYLFA
jgi:hypothetical protein